MSSPLRRSPTPSSTSTSIPTSTSNPPITTTTSTTTTTTAALTNPKTALFTFRHAPPSPLLTFPFRPSSSPSSTATHDPITPVKRPRPLTDIDGELSTLGKKKRRLRLFLITSRLSRPFSSPASNIVDRGSSKIAVWAKQKSSLGRHLLRKAAILNRVRRRAAAGGAAVPQGEKERRQLEIARAAFADAAHEMHARPVLQRRPPFPPTAAVREGRYFALGGCVGVGAGVGAGVYPGSRYPGVSTGPSSSATATATATAAGGGSRPWSGSSPDSHNTPYSYSYPPPPSAALPVRLPRRNYLPLPPSPLGISNYDALDLEDEIRSPYDDDDDDDLSSSDAEMLDSPCSTSASYSSTVETSGDAARTPPFPVQYYSDFSVLDPEEAVVGDYDGVDGAEGVEPVWPGERLGGEVRKFGGVGTEEEGEGEVVVFKFY